MLIGLSAWLVVGLVAEWILPAPKEVVEGLRHAIAPTDGGRGTLLTLFLMALTPAICEEALFRGPILRGLRTRLSPTGAAILTGLLFGIYHSIPGASCRPPSSAWRSRGSRSPAIRSFRRWWLTS